MVPAAMAKQPEHDFAPSWLKIPHSNQITHQSSGDHRLSGGKHQYHSDSRSRQVPLYPNHGYSRQFHRGGSATHVNDERRMYPNRQHSADDLMSMTDGLSLNHNSSGMFSPPPPHGFSTETFFPNPNQYRGRFGPGTREGMPRGREEGYNGRSQSRGVRHHSGGRQRYPSGNSHTGSKERSNHADHRKDGFYPRTSHSEDRSKSSDRAGLRLSKEAGAAGDRVKDAGGEKDSSALSSQDFPSLSGDKDEQKETAKPPQPAGAWDNRPGTPKYTTVGGKPYKFIQKTTHKDTKESGTPKASILSARSTSTSSTGAPPPSSSSSSTRGIISVKSINTGLKLTAKVVNTKVTPRNLVTKETTISKDKPGVVTNSNGNSSNPPAVLVDPPPAKPPSLTLSQPVDVPSSRLTPGSRVKKVPKNNFLLGLRNSNATENGGYENEDYNFNRASSLNHDMAENEKNLHDSSINSVEITTSLENGYLDADASWDDTSTSDNTSKLSSSLEAEQRLLREMGWHEHSDNEDGYAPITEDERREFKLRSQQLKRNGLTKPDLVNLLSSSLPVNALINHVNDEGRDSEDCSSSDSSDDEH